jgi:hypothetical protein
MDSTRSLESGWESDWKQPSTISRPTRKRLFAEQEY